MNAAEWYDFLATFVSSVCRNQSMKDAGSIQARQPAVELAVYVCV